MKGTGGGVKKKKEKKKLLSLGSLTYPFNVQIPFVTEKAPSLEQNHG